MAALRVRRSLQDLQDDYDNGTKKPLEDLMRAWKGIKALPATDPHSFFMLGGYHGEPFRGAGWGNSAYWGGYCNHGNVLFPTWHRVYLLKLEEALQSIPGCEDVMLPFWDQTDSKTLPQVIPTALTAKDFVLDGETIANPLRSFVFNRNIVDHISGDNPNYSKPMPYETVRYPLSGLVGSPEEKDATDKHNAQFPDYDTNVGYLNANVYAWIYSQPIVKGKPISGNIKDKYTNCLQAPNYTVFSNTTSAAEWNGNLDAGIQKIVPLESPHNAIHLAVGGFDVRSGPNKGDFSPISGANGDMGENDTAGMDPIFFFHHCNVDRMFWLWQKKHGCTNSLEIIPEYPGTNSVDNQGPTPGIMPNSWLTLETPLNPFQKGEGALQRTYTSLDCINIESQMGYTYGPGSLDELATVAPQLMRVQSGFSTKTIRVTGINRAAIRGSFVVAAYAIVDGEKQLIGTEPVLSRWHVQGCSNCMTHQQVKAYIGLHDFDENSLADVQFTVEVNTRDGKLSQLRGTNLLGPKPFSVSIE